MMEMAQCTGGAYALLMGGSVNPLPQALPRAIPEHKSGCNPGASPSVAQKQKL